MEQNYSSIYTNYYSVEQTSFQDRSIDTAPEKESVRWKQPHPKESSLPMAAGMSSGACPSVSC